MRRFPVLRVSLIPAFLLLATPTLAMPLVFDFDDGTTQGWTFIGDAFITETKDIFAEGVDLGVLGLAGAEISLTLDLTDIQQMTWDEFLPTIATGPHAPSQILFVLAEPGSSPPFDFIGGGRPLSLTNPFVRSFDLSELSGEHTLRIGWPADPTAEPPRTGLPVLIDDIAFLPIPEPQALTTWVLVSVIVRLVVRRARERSP